MATPGPDMLSRDDESVDLQERRVLRTRRPIALDPCIVMMTGFDSRDRVRASASAVACQEPVFRGASWRFEASLGGARVFSLDSRPLPPLVRRSSTRNSEGPLTGGSHASTMMMSISGEGTSLRIGLLPRDRQGMASCLRSRKCLQAGRLCSRTLADLRPPRPGILLRRLPATAGSLRRFQADSCAGSPRDEKKPAVVLSNTYADLQVFYGSDGTRTGDLRRDRPVWRLRGKRE